MAHYSMSFHPNHMIMDFLESQDAIIPCLKYTKILVILACHTRSIIPKWVNIGTVFWATVNLWLGRRILSLLPLHMSPNIPYGFLGSSDSVACVILPRHMAWLLYHTTHCELLFWAIILICLTCCINHSDWTLAL